LSDQERLERGFDGPEASTQGFLELKRICELACCWDFIKDFPLQLETRIGTKGIKLSGGQTQCLTIARALIKNPACLILDEATAALDNETQKRVSQNIGTLQRQQGFTVIQIAHRLTTLTNSDIIYFLRHGVVVESGGCEKQDGTAVQELNKIEIIHKLVKNPETNEEEQRVTQGFFHHHWNVANDVQSFHELTSKQLLSKIRELRDDLDMAQAEIKSKNLKRLLPPLVLERALTSPSGDHVVGEQLDNFMKLAKSAEKVSSFENLDTESSCRVAPTIPHTLPAGKSVLAKWPISLDRAASG
jgi:ABC-type sugar transport system ATPase subunit